jgi:hypothetical protein
VVPTISDTLEPQMRRLGMSRPRASVPNRWTPRVERSQRREEGRSCSVGSMGEVSGAKTASRIADAMIARPRGGSAVAGVKPVFSRLTSYHLA